MYVVIARACNFKQKPCGTCGLPKSNKIHRKPDKGGTCEFKLKLRCARCELPKAHEDHLGQPPSWNELLMRGGYQRAKETWGVVLKKIIEESDLPKGEVVDGRWTGISFILVEGDVTFPRPATPKGPDQGNFRGPLEKILGDVLEEGGWIENDNWESYSFGNLGYLHEPGVSRTRLALMPRC